MYMCMRFHIQYSCIMVKKLFILIDRVKNAQFENFILSNVFFGPPCKKQSTNILAHPVKPIFLNLQAYISDNLREGAHTKIRQIFGLVLGFYGQ